MSSSLLRIFVGRTPEEEGVVSAAHIGDVMHIGFKNLDPYWTQFAASLREGQVYIKMPVAKARALVLVWHILSQKVMHTESVLNDMTDLIKLITEEAVASQSYGIKSVFYMVPMGQCGKDIEVIGYFVEEDKTGVFRKFKESLEKGLQSDPEVDWIARVREPQAHPFEALQEDLDPVDVSLDDLFDLDGGPFS